MRQLSSRCTGHFGIFTLTSRRCLAAGRRGSTAVIISRPCWYSLGSGATLRTCRRRFRGQGDQPEGCSGNPAGASGRGVGAGRQRLLPSRGRSRWEWPGSTAGGWGRWPTARFPGLCQPVGTGIGGGAVSARELDLGRLQEYLGTRLEHPEGVWVLDGSDFPKQGRKSVGVAWREYCGRLAEGSQGPRSYLFSGGCDRPAGASPAKSTGPSTAGTGGQLPGGDVPGLCQPVGTGIGGHEAAGLPGGAGNAAPRTVRANRVAAVA